MGLFFVTDKQNELELPLPPSKARERKRRHQHQQQQQLLMSHISGVRKVTHGPSITGGCSVARFGVKTDMEDLLSKVKRPVVLQPANSLLLLLCIYTTSMWRDIFS